MIPSQGSQWYADASLTVGSRLVRAGTLIQCARRWGRLLPEERQQAIIRLAQPVDGHTILQGEQIAALAAHPGYRFA